MQMHRTAVIGGVSLLAMAAAQTITAQLGEAGRTPLHVQYPREYGPVPRPSRDYGTVQLNRRQRRARERAMRKRSGR